MDTVWVTVDRLIHDLGAIRAFVDEAEATPGASGAPQVADVRGAMDAATEAITRIFGTSPEDTAIAAAWTAVARAQDAVAAARGVLAATRAGHSSAETTRELNRLPPARLSAHAQVVGDQAGRARRPVHSRPKSPAAPAPDRQGS